MDTGNAASVSLQSFLSFPEPMTTLNSLDPRVLETEIARMGDEEWRFIAGFPQEGWISFQMPIRSAPVAACWQSPWTGGLLRCGVVPARCVPTEGTGTQGSILLGKAILGLMSQNTELFSP